jgi:outer membrane protein TolC
MKKQIMVTAALLLCSVSVSEAVSLHTLLEGVKKRPQYQLDTIAVQQGALGERKVDDKLLPTLDGFAAVELYNRPSSLRPVLPSEMQQPQNGLPFSKKIGRAGVQFAWPVFVKSLYTLKEKAALMHMAAKEKQRLNLISHEAEVVGAVANMRYLETLKSALHAKKRSILATRRKVALMVKEGRAAQSELLTLDTHLNEIDINLVNIDKQRNALSAKVETLTGIALHHAVPVRQKRKVKKGEIFALKPLQRRVEASQRGVKAAKEGYYPTLALKGSYTHSQADAYNNDKSISTDFGSMGLYLSMPLYDRSKSTSIEEAKLSYLKEKTYLEDTRESLRVRGKELSREIGLLNRSMRLARKSVRDQKALLKVAKVSLENGVITQEEYLRYEDALASARANVAQIEAQKWQDIAQLAVIYGNDLKGIVK